ncbi:oxidoreductase [Rothia sp. P6271]|uniref:oxidoreductase n=1 Tax=unclassified Rothia (in: high G+C Gram-positive bacteria) TaxID=2689056 RepID=UPI003AC21EA1
MSAVIIITGASSGIGYDAAVSLAQQGHRVYAVARRVQLMEPLKQYGVTPLYADVTDEETINKVVDFVLAEAGRIDVLINNAGYGMYGAIEDVSLAEARHQFDVNVFGLAAFTRAVLPAMREAKRGRIINVSSIAGRLTTSFGGWYHATKYALEGLSDSLRMELGPLGIEVVLIEPGAIASQWSDVAIENLERVAEGGAYENSARATAERMRQLYARWASDPQVITRALVQAVSASRPRTRYVAGFGARPLLLAHSVLPSRLWDKLARGK